MASASLAGSVGGTSHPGWPSSTNSGLPPTRVGTTGKPPAMASRIGLEIDAVVHLCHPVRVNTHRTNQPVRKVDAHGDVPMHQRPNDLAQQVVFEVRTIQIVDVTAMLAVDATWHPG